MTTKNRVPLPCRYFHTAQGCPYGKWCKYDHYSNNPSYFNYIKQKLHQISKPQKRHNNSNQNMIHIIIESMQKCMTDIINKEFHSLYQEINALKSTIDKQHKWMQNHNKHLSESVFTKQIKKISKLLKQNHTAIVSKHKSNNNTLSNTIKKDDEWNNIFAKLRGQLKELHNDKQQFETQLSCISSKSDHTTISTIPPPRNTKKRTQRKQTPFISKISPFDNISQYDNVFEDEIALNTNTVTMDQISALPIPPKTKPNRVKKNMKQRKVISITSSNVRHKDDNRTKKKQLLVKGKNKKWKRNRSVCKKQQCRAKQMKQKHNDGNRESIHKKIQLPVLSYMNDTDWYQIVRSDSSDDESNMTTEDAKKLDMLDSI